MKKEPYSFEEVEALLHKAAHAEKCKMSEAMQVRFATALSTEARRIVRHRYVRRLSMMAALFIAIIGICWWQIPDKSTPMATTPQEKNKAAMAVTMSIATLLPELRDLHSQDCYYPFPQRYLISDSGKKRSVMSPGGFEVNIYSCDL